ncbi:sigma-70 family RNA polymerase sigma factor [Comamonas composti]|uniref:sigma-70 family RNA polymerase sigma factor n=1 Tax=Comamonas composti TaxID=408558 RepID=UPI0004188383|nr:sigma-70 family RNA polymerase sigma factor [Comamonas composti]
MELSTSFTRALLSGFDRAYADLLRVAARSTGCREEAGDLVHDTWLRLAEHAQSGAGERQGAAEEDAPRDVTAYLAVMAQHMALDAHRRRQRHGDYLDSALLREQLAPSHTPDVADAVMYRQALSVLEAALTSLPERSRSAFVAHRIHGEKQPEIAQRLGLSLNTVERDLMQASACIEDALHRWRGGNLATSARRAGRRRSLGALLGLAGLGLGGHLVWEQYRQNYVQWHLRCTSGRGEQNRLALPDGSMLLLDAMSSADVRYFAARRTVELTQGAAFFDVERSPERPFIVQAGGVRVVVLGTRFGVELSEAGDEAAVGVQVESGRVRVEAAGGNYELQAGQGLKAQGASVLSVQTQPQDAAAWRHGELVFSHSTLGEAVQRLSRYTSWSLEVSPEAAGLPVSGRVRIAHAQAWVQALPRALPVQVRHRAQGNGLVVSAR